jgi:hypothetical protein
VTTLDRLKSLTARLNAIGITTPERRKSWIERITDKKIAVATDMTDDDLGICERYLSVVDTAMKVFPGAKVRNMFQVR